MRCGVEVLWLGQEHERAHASHCGRRVQQPNLYGLLRCQTLPVHSRSHKEKGGGWAFVCTFFENLVVLVSFLVISVQMTRKMRRGKKSGKKLVEKNRGGVGGLKRENGWFSLFLLWLYVYFLFCRKKHFLFLLSAAKDQSNRGDLNGFLSNNSMKKNLERKWGIIPPPLRNPHINVYTTQSKAPDLGTIHTQNCFQTHTKETTQNRNNQYTLYSTGALLVP